MKSSRRGRREDSRTRTGGSSKSKSGKRASLQPQLPVPRACTIPRDYPAPVCTEFAKLILQKRLKHRLSKYRLSKLSGVAERTIGHAQHGRHKPSLDTAQRILAVFGMAIRFGRSNGARPV